MKTSNSICLALAFCLFAEGHATVAAALPPGVTPADANVMQRNSAGAQMERDRRAIERERVMEQIAEDEAAKKNKVEQGEAPSAGEAETEISFELQQVIWNPSEILSQEEIHAVADVYI